MGFELFQVIAVGLLVLQFALISVLYVVEWHFATKAKSSMSEKTSVKGSAILKEEAHVTHTFR